VAVYIIAGLGFVCISCNVSLMSGFNLSTLKTKIRTIFGKRLSETVFHQTKLLELVQLSPIDQIVKIVKLQGNCGYLCQPNWATWSEWAKPDFRDSFNFRRPRAGMNRISLAVFSFVSLHLVVVPAQSCDS